MRWPALWPGGVLAWFTVGRRRCLAESCRRAATVRGRRRPCGSVISPARWAPKRPGEPCRPIFPSNEYLVHRAEQQLALIYLREGNYQPACASVSKKLAPAMDDEEFRAFGLAGQCGLLSLEGRYKESADVLEPAWPIHDKAQTIRRCRQMLDRAIQREPREAGRPDRRRSGRNGWTNNFSETD